MTLRPKYRSAKMRHHLCMIYGMRMLLTHESPSQPGRHPGILREKEEEKRGGFMGGRREKRRVDATVDAHFPSSAIAYGDTWRGREGWKGQRSARRGTSIGIDFKNLGPTILGPYFEPTVYLAV